MSEFEVTFTVHLLPFPSRVPHFVKHTVRLDPMRDTSTSIKDKVGVRGLVVHQAVIILEAEVIKNWFVEGHPIVIVQCASDFEEPDDWVKNPNQIARLLNAKTNIDCAMTVLSRAFWQEGFQQFLESATFLRNLVDSTGLNDYQRRIDLLCVSYPRKELMPVAPFNENDGRVMLPPLLRGETNGGDVIGEWVDVPRSALSNEESGRIRETASGLKQKSPYLELAAKSVVRIFGYHAASHDGDLNAQRQRVFSFTGFFVSPKHILTSRTAKFSEASNTYAHRYTFSRNTRAIHGMLREDVDLFDCFEVPDVVDFTADSIRNIGIVVEQLRMPEGFASAPWCDFMLLQVTHQRHFSSETGYLLPQLDIAEGVKQGSDVFALHYSERPSAEYVEEMFGEEGHCKQDVKEEHLRTQFWHYDTKVCSIGQALADVETSRSVKHNCSVLNGSRGAPLISQTHVDFNNDAARKKELGEDSGGLELACTFAGMITGRDRDLFERERENIMSMSTSELARVESLGLNMYNTGAGGHHISLILLYIKHIAPAITNVDHRTHLQKFLDPFAVLVSRDLLAQCHRKMLKDADDFNEHGMDFYEHQDLNSALSCFREGAKMFSTASIPNLTQYEIDLKNALQTNVSAVVVAKLNSNSSNN